MPRPDAGARTRKRGGPIDQLIGRKLGHYLIQDRLGGGGMGTVYRGVHELLQQVRAVKVMAPHLASLPRFVMLFRREAMLAASLQHPGIVHIYDVSEQDGYHYIVMELLHGTPLRDVVQQEGQLPLVRALAILGQLAEALDFAHEQRVSHRDVKPENVILERGDRVKLVDFGIARAADGTRLSITHRVGTPEYMAPEVFDEEILGPDVEPFELGVGTDRYALGVLAFELLAGRVPFTGRTPQSVAFAHVNRDAPLLRSLRPELPAAVEGVFRRQLAKHPGERYDSATAFVNGLAGVLGLPAPAVPEGGPAPSASPSLIGQGGVSTRRQRTPAPDRGDVTGRGNGAVAIPPAPIPAAPMAAASAPAASHRPAAVPPAPLSGAPVSAPRGGTPLPPLPVTVRREGQTARGRLLPVAGGLVLLVAVAAGGAWALSGADRASAPEAASAGAGSTPAGLGLAGNPPTVGVAAPAPAAAPTTAPATGPTSAGASAQPTAAPSSATAPATATPVPPTATPGPGQRLQAADAILQSGDTGRAIELLLALRQADPGTPGLDDALYRAYVAHGRARLEAGDLDGAWGAYGEALALRPDDLNARNGQTAVILAKQWRQLEGAWGRDDDAALAAAEEIYRIDPGFRDVRDKLYALLIARADRQLAAGDRAGAHTVLMRALEVRPDGAEARERLRAYTPTPAPTAPPAAPPAAAPRQQPAQQPAPQQSQPAPSQPAPAPAPASQPQPAQQQPSTQPVRR